MSTSIAGKTIWLTGASSGIGLALAKKLAAADNMVFVTARSEHKLTELKNKYPKNVDVVCGDISHSDGLREIRAQLNQKTDFLDLIIVNAGTCEYQDNLQLNIEQYKRVYDINFFGALASIDIAIPLLKNCETESRIAVVSSLSTVVPFARAEIYGSSKAALEYFLRAFSIDLVNENIKTTLIRPGFVDTPLTKKNDFDMPFIISAELAAEHILKAIKKRKAVYEFPSRFALMLKAFACMPWVWMNYVGPKLSKTQKNQL